MKPEYRDCVVKHPLIVKIKSTITSQQNCVKLCDKRNTKVRNSGVRKRTIVKEQIYFHPAFAVWIFFCAFSLDLFQRLHTRYSYYVTRINHYIVEICIIDYLLYRWKKNTARPNISFFFQLFRLTYWTRNDESKEEDAETPTVTLVKLNLYSCEESKPLQTASNETSFNDRDAMVDNHMQVQAGPKENGCIEQQQ